MPISEYFKGKGEQVMENMRHEYGEGEGKRVFYALANKSGLKPPKPKIPKIRGKYELGSVRLRD